MKRFSKSAVSYQRSAISPWLSAISYQCWLLFYSPLGSCSQQAIFRRGETCLAPTTTHISRNLGISLPRLTFNLLFPIHCWLNNLKLSTQHLVLSTQHFALRTLNLPLLTFIFLLLTFISACTPAALPTPTLPPPALEQSAWGDIVTVGRAPIAAAPALTAQANGQLMLAWASPDAEKMRLYARHVTTGQPVILVLPAYYPAEVTIFPADDDNFHLLWYDRTPEANFPRLLSGRISPDAVAQLGANPLAPDALYHYSVLSMADNELLIVWSGALAAEPTLFLQALDAQGRVRFPVTLVSDSDYPALVQTPTGTLWLFWILRGRDVLRATLADQTLGAVLPVTPMLPLSTTDQLERMTAAVDETHGYLFWQLIRADGTPEVWFTSGRLDTPQAWQRPRLLTIALDETQTLKDNAVSPNTYPAQESAAGQPLQWVMPLNQPQDMVRVAANIGDFLGILVFRDGAIMGYEPVVKTGRLAGIPAIAMDNEDRLTLAWSQPGDDGLSALRYTQQP